MLCFFQSILQWLTIVLRVKCVRWCYATCQFIQLTVVIFSNAIVNEPFHRTVTDEVTCQPSSFDLCLQKKMAFHLIRHNINAPMRLIWDRTKLKRFYVQTKSKKWLGFYLIQTERQSERVLCGYYDANISCKTYDTDMYFVLWFDISFESAPLLM